MNTTKVTIPSKHFYGKSHCSQCGKHTDSIIKFVRCDIRNVFFMSTCGVCTLSQEKKVSFSDWNNTVPTELQSEIQF